MYLFKIYFLETRGSDLRCWTFKLISDYRMTRWARNKPFHVFFFFFNFLHGQVRENPSKPLERAPLNKKIDKFESDSLKTNKDLAKFYRRLCGEVSYK